MAPFAQYKGGKSTDGDQPEEGNRRSLRATKTPGHKAEHMVTHGEPLKLAVKKKRHSARQLLRKQDAQYFYRREQVLDHVFYPDHTSMTM